MKIVKDPILRIDRFGWVKECHYHPTSDPALIAIGFEQRNIRDFDFLFDLIRSVELCLQTQESQSAYFTLNYQRERKHYEVLIEPDDEDEVLAIVKEITKKKQRENELLEYYNLLQSIYEGTSSSTGRDYLDQLTYQLSKAMKADYTAVCVVDPRKDVLETVSISFKGKKVENTTWKINGSPYEEVIANSYLEIKQGFKNRFSRFELNYHHLFNGFIGVPLFYNQIYSKPIGFMFALYELPLFEGIHNEKILQIFSSRAAAELERIENQRKIEYSEERFKALYNNTPAYFSSTNKSGVVIEVGDYFLEKTGYSRGDVIGKWSIDFLTPASKKYAIRKVMPKFLKKGYCKDVALEFVKKNGDIMEVMLSATLIKDQAGKFVKTIMNLNDVTLLRKIERELRESEERVIQAANRFQLLFDNSPVGIIIHTAGVIRHVNSETIRLARGNSIYDFIGKTAMSFVHPESKSAAQARIDKIYETKKAHRNEQKFLCVDGSVIEVEAMGTLIEYEGEPSVQIAFYDISDRKNAERRILERDKELKTLNENLARQNNQLEEFAHIASHNLRAPITNMLSLIKIREADSSEATQQFVWDNLGKTVRNLDETIIELNDVVKTSWELDKQRKTLRFQDVLEKILNSIVDQIAKADAEFDVKFEMSTVFYPKIYLESIIQNLVTNAIKYKKPHERAMIYLRSWEKNGRGYFSIEDNGMGINLEKYGSRLFGLRKTFHSNHDARGVGLFITKAQIESLGGSIFVESTEGVGTKFIVDFGTLKLISTDH
ncbi:PAS domain S-box protein [Reichenbachiella agarivorans]|uniref:histidine kinase n=1 Tax=Reichenbachiella agarivorans TaxID=2979464 RepID=A0ABY6CQH8_9BACT|nr:PAS domain S-box protein [Reichenbachiella agarivorans]UXP30555.1 PAS domain S-box protein [Reichenbachiella agarivorans]